MRLKKMITKDATLFSQLFKDFALQCISFYSMTKRIALLYLFEHNEQTNNKRLCRDATAFSTLVLFLKLGGEPCTYHDDGEYPHPTSCRKYLVCYKHQAFEATCPSYLWFNDDTKECDSPANTYCSSKLIPLYFSTSFSS